MVMGFGEPTIEMQAELNRILGVPVVRPTVAVQSRAEILAGQGRLPVYGAGMIPGWQQDVPTAAVPGIQPLPAAPAVPAGYGEAVLAGLSGLGIAIPEPVTTGLGLAGAAYLGYQALGGGEGEGLFGLDILGGGGAAAGNYLNGIPLGGPGLAEPPAQWVIKEWHVNYDWGRLQYYLVQMPTGGRKIAMYNTRTKRWKAWRWRSPILAVIGKNMPSHKQLTRLKRNLKRHTADAKTILKITAPTAYAKQLGYRQYKRRR